MYNLFLDDCRDAREPANYMPTYQRDIYNKLKWVVVRNYDEFVIMIEKNGLPQLISFDHDLADEHYHNMPELPTDAVEEYYGAAYTEKTGYDCAKWLVEYCLNNNKSLPEFIVHSMNPVGKKNIQSLLGNFKNR
jgi:hypothetical protein